MSALFEVPRCRCGHHMDAHHRTPRGRFTWCSVWDPNRCDCIRFEEAS